MKVLIAGADPVVKSHIEAICRSRWPNCELEQIGDTERFLEAVEIDPPDVVLLDDRVGSDGFALCRGLREFSAVPVIMLTARHENSDVIKAVDSGADFLLRLPAQEPELVAGITTLVRRYKRQPLVAESRPVAFGPLYMDFGNNEVQIEGKPIKLTFTELEILRCLATNTNQTMPSSRLAWMVWGDDGEASLDSLKVHVKNLRQKLGESATNPRYIHSERGVGYRFVTRRSPATLAPLAELVLPRCTA